MIELIFVLGPLLTAVIATVLSPPAALIVSAVSVVAGTVTFTALPPSRALAAGPRPAARRPARARWRRRACARSSSRRCPPAIGIGICEVAIPAFSDAEGAAALAGVLLALWSIGSACGGLAYGALRNRPPLHARAPRRRRRAADQPAADGRRAVGAR